MMNPIIEMRRLHCKPYHELMQIAIDKYQKEEVVLSPGNLENKQIMLYDKSNDSYSDWIEF